MEVGSGPVPGRDPHAVDAFAPREVAQRVQVAGVEDANRPVMQMFALAVVGGSMLALAAATSTAVLTGVPNGTLLPRVVAGAVFGIGLAMVMVGGGELFTSNNLIAMAWVSRQVRTGQLLLNWGVVLLGNAIGAASIAVLLVVGGAYNGADNGFGAKALEVAIEKSDRALTQHVALGILGNALVCLAVWLCFSARSTTDRILACVLPMTLLVILNVDHIVANLHYKVAGLLLRLDPTFAPVGGDAPLPVGGILTSLGGVTLGNIIGGSVLVAAVYWFVYLRHAPEVAHEPGSAAAASPPPP
jgi:formate transporter